MLSRCLISSQNVSARKTLVCAAINCAVNKRAERLSQSSFPRRVIGSVTIVGPAPVLPLPCLQAQPFLNSLHHVHTTSVDKAPGTEKKKFKTWDMASPQGYNKL